MDKIFKTDTGAAKHAKRRARFENRTQYVSLVKGGPNAGMYIVTSWIPREKYELIYSTDSKPPFAR